jgi:hypothetical protein
MGEGGRVLKTAPLLILVASTAFAAAGDVESGLARLLGDSGSGVPAVVSGLKGGMSPAEARKVLPGLPASVTGQKSYEPGRVVMKDPMLEAVELKFHSGKLTTATLVFRRSVDRAAFKAASLKLIEAKWSVKAPAAERNEDLLTLMPGGLGVQRSFLVDHWELEVELPQP